MRKLLHWLNWTLLLPLLVIVLLFAILLYTAPGLKFSLWLGEKFVPELTIGEHQGSLLGGMQLSKVNWQDGNNKLQVNQLHLDINNLCFFQLKLCVSAVTLDGLKLTIVLPDDTAAATETVSAEPESTSASSLLLPFPINIDKLALTNSEVQIGANTLRWQNFSTSIEGWGRQLQFNDSQWHQLQVALAASAEPGAEPFRYQAPELADITLPIAVFINNFQLTQASLLQEDTQTALPDLSFSLQARDQSIRLLDFQASHPQANVTATAEITTQGNYPLRARVSSVLQQAPLAGQQFSVSLTGSLADLALSARSSGIVNARLEAELALLSADLPLQVKLEYEPLRWPVGDDDAWQMHAGDLTASGDLQQLQFSLNAGIAHSSVPEVNLSATGDYQHANMALTLSQFNANTLGGSIAGIAALNLGTPLTWQTDLTLSTIQPGLFWPEFAGELNGKLQNRGQLAADGSWQTTLPQLAVTGELRSEKVAINGDVAASYAQSTDTYRFSTEQLVLQHGSNSVNVTGSLAEQWQLNAKVNITDLASSLPDANGTINADINVSGNQLQPEINASVTASELRYADSRLAELTLQAQLQLNELYQASIELSATGGRWQEYQLEQLNLSAAGNEQQHQLSLELQSSLSDISLKLAGKLTDRSHWQGTLTDTDIGSPLGNWQLQQALTLAYQLDKQQLELSAHCWQQGTGKLCLTEPASMSAEQLNASIELTQFDLTGLNDFTPTAINITGELNANASANWQSGQSPQLALTVQSASGALTQQTEPPIALQWQSFQLTAQLQDDQLTANAEGLLNEQARLTANLTVTDVTADQRPLSASLQLTDFTLAFLQPLLDEYSELAGVLSADISADGTLESPMLTGQLALEQLRVKGTLAPADINDGSLQLNFKGEQAALQGNIATPDGKLTIKGDADWQQLSDWRAQLAVTGDPLRIQIPQGSLNIKPDLTISATPSLTKVSGEIQIPSAELSVDELPQNAIGLSNDTVILNTENQPINEQQASAMPIEANIRIVLGEKVNLKAFGLQTLLRGRLQVQQRQNRQTINGEVSLVDGTFRSYGQDLLIRQGKMNFTGPPDQPFLNIEAIRNPANMEDAVVAGIRVTGPADRPQIVIFSEPAMPQANALSYLLVGRDLDSESGSAANAVTTSLIGMSIASSGSFVGEIGEAFGVSDLTLDTAGSGDSSQVTVSGYINRNLQIKYGIGIFEPIGVFTLRYRLMQSLYLEAVSGLDVAVDLLYRFEFD